MGDGGAVNRWMLMFKCEKYSSRTSQTPLPQWLSVVLLRLHAGRRASLAPCCPLSWSFACHFRPLNPLPTRRWRRKIVKWGKTASLFALAADICTAKWGRRGRGAPMCFLLHRNSASKKCKKCCACWWEWNALDRGGTLFWSPKLSQCWSGKSWVSQKTDVLLSFITLQWGTGSILANYCSGSCLHLVRGWKLLWYNFVSTK